MLDLKQIVYMGWDRNMICVDKDTEIGKYTDRLRAIMFTILQKSPEDKDAEIFKVVDLNDYLDYFQNELGGMLPLKRIKLCALVDELAIIKNGLQKEYVILGAY